MNISIFDNFSFNINPSQITVAFCKTKNNNLLFLAYRYDINVL